MNVYNESFGGSSEIEVGDVVSWSNLSQEFTGVVSGFLSQSGGGRNVIFASVFCFENQKNTTVLALNLKRISKNDKQAIEN